VGCGGVVSQPTFPIGQPKARPQGYVWDCGPPALEEPWDCLVSWIAQHGAL